MTITKKPARAPDAPAGDTAAAAFIQAAELAPAAAPATDAFVADAAAAESAAEPLAQTKAKAGEKDKAAKKDKEKEKDKDKDKKKKKKDKKNKEAVIIRFDDTQLPQIDNRAVALGLSRAAWVRMVVAQALAQA